VLSITAFTVLVRSHGWIEDYNAYLATLLAILGVATECLSYDHTKNSAGSVSMIPFAACALIAPSAFSVVAITLAHAVVQVISRRPPLKTAFNVAQISLSFSLALLAYHRVGGVAFQGLEYKAIVPAARFMLFPITTLLVVVMLSNATSVSAIISATAAKPFWATLQAHTRATAPFAFVVVLIAFYLTWLSVNLGVFGMAGMVLPMFAVRQLYRTTNELTTVTEELLDLMVAAIEARDPYTSGHSKRVAEASRIIARAMGLRPEQVERVEVAALLHDVGKIDEQFARVLAKEGRLTPDEWETMKRHPVRSAELVGLLSSLRDIVPAVRHHHENWDGTGYPSGLRGEAIPLGSRIIMFADTLDAITTDRPYRKALAIEEARNEFLKFKGKQFDPTICDVVVSQEAWEELYRSFIAGHQSAGSAVGTLTEKPPGVVAA
jgi:putative nucleotidyltransferase with HDIG domain